MTLHSSLSRYQGRQPATQEDLYDMRRKAWVWQGIACFDPEDIPDEWTRQVIINEAVRQHGARSKRRAG